jgi:hypothetical protein
MPGARQQAEHGAEGILDHDAISQDDRRERRRRHRVSVTDLSGDDRNARLDRGPCRPPIDITGAATCNDEVGDSTRDADADVIVSGREPRRRARRPGRLIRLLVVAQTVALAVAIAVAVHYRAEAGRPDHSGAQAASPPASPMPQVTSAALRLPAGGGVTGTVVITAAALPGVARAQFTVSAVIAGGTPGTVYDLIGSDCSTGDPRPDEVWAAGLARADGTADLTGYTWTAAVAHRYWMALDPSPPGPAPGLHGHFAAGTATPFRRGQAPCAVSP